MALSELSIRNFAIIKQLEIEMDDGLTVVTGETGAGKSIVLGALNLLLGARAETDMIRHQEDQCEITALFDIKGMSNVEQWMELKDLTADDASQCLIRRIVRRNKPTKCYVNDQPTTLAALKELGLLLVDLHGQHEHQSLLRKSTQREIIDQFADHDEQLALMAKLAVQIKRIESELAALNQNHSDSADRMELLLFQLSELEEASIDEGEFATLETEYSRLNNAQELISGIRTASDGLFHNESSNVSSELGKQINQLSELVEFDANLQPANELLNSALVQIEESQKILDSALAQIEQDPERLQETEQRRDTLINLARKHRCGENELPARLITLQTEYQRLENKHNKPEELQKQLDKLLKHYQKIAHEVSEKRSAVAAQLSELISKQMQGLGMRGGRLELKVEPRIDDQLIVSEHGMDLIEYSVSTNHGVPVKPLHKTASGGELSRISLAIQVITSEKSHTPTLVFDEVDVGVGGKVAQIVGRRLKKLGKTAQVICITHLPQVAAQGDQHIYINKISDDTETYSTLVKLNKEMRADELARMLGGEQITDRTLAHAREMLSASNK